MDEVTKKSRAIMGRTLAFVNKRYGHLLPDLPGGRRFGLDEYDLMPFREPMVRRRDGFYECGKLDDWSFHLSKGGNLRDGKGRKPRRKYRTKRIVNQFGCAWTHCQNTKRRQKQSPWMIGNWSYSDEGGFR